MSGRLAIAWEPPGPVAAGYMSSRARVPVLNGPVGSGKTTTVLIKAVRIAGEQAPSPRKKARDERGREVPIRLFKLCVVRDTYRQLWKTTIPSWHKRVPKEVGQWTGAEGTPATHKVNFQLDDGSIVDFHVDFIAIGENSVEDAMRGYEPTAFYLNEMDLLTSEVLMYARGRAGRYPDMEDGGPTWYGVLADCNAPEAGSWLHKDIFTKSPAELRDIDVDLFIQPSGLSPAAENTKNLPPGYYPNQCKGAEQWYVERMVKNRPGYSRAAKPVYPDFEDARHVAAEDLNWAIGLPLLVGVDAGGSPAAVFGQRMPNGRWHILDELVADHGTGAVRFGAMLTQRLRERFPHAGTIIGYADPSAFYGADKDAGEKNWAEIVAAKAEIVIRPGPTNDPTSRWDAVRAPLTRSVDAGPAFLLSPRCTVLRTGFNSGYRFKKINPNVDRYQEQADKNEYSHPHDALQYMISAGGEDIEIRARANKRDRRPAGNVHEHDWDPYNAGANA